MRRHRLRELHGGAGEAHFSVPDWMNLHTELYHSILISRPPPGSLTHWDVSIRTPDLSNEIRVARRRGQN